MTESMDIDGVLPTSSSSKGKQPELSTGGDNLPWVEKYRPSSLDELVSQRDIVDTLQRFIDDGKLPHLLFYGPPGTGKTTTILAIARKLYGGKNMGSMVLELNASDDRGIDVIRDQIKTFASTRTVFSSGLKLVILDEADAMTTPAQAALRRVIEKYTMNVRFCIICNYVSKIIPAVQSRCTRFRFAPLRLSDINSRLDMIVEREGVNISEDGKNALIRLSAGDMRRVLNVLQACHAAYDRIDCGEVYACTGQPSPEDIKRIVDWMLNDEFHVALSNIVALKRDKGLALQDIISELTPFVNNVDFPPVTRVYLLEQLAEIESHMAVGSTEKIQLSALVGTFKIGIELASGN
ncbi:Subunit of heteropentameric Replication factor C (RF-C) [Coemansia sp. RSA 376]|nr:Subunit of heteropentameric Replication factor C (RF-C) [Coemansia sp. S680]KAJ2032965.1 Subunit of heteropentameric Replication factor C (RF-C) [Coemansia sp. S3946]KAJ2044313.1 Subunit of heteropentameric Replication factor C (RF-C) [Coemansia sp. S2]KAJ2047029.1 Subunit of heteropentameric Replication factor C (RF-C) [Coemansia sp. S16]KAJ2050531.1 Subunit of heteropentameric Replication factor C (RF-C) [Coemansia sp. S155-1]KAJ2116060.1 Subunit of heteropentameric Replication factor C (